MTTRARDAMALLAGAFLVVMVSACEPDCPKQRQPIVEGDLRRVMAALQKVMDHEQFESTNASIFLFASGDIHVSVKIDGVEILGVGHDLRTAVEALRGKAHQIDQALAGGMP